MSTDGFTIFYTFLAAYLLLVLVSKVRRRGVALVAAVTAATWVLVSPAPAVGATCTIVGTAKSETLTGTSGEDVICGFGGNDFINGNGGNDHLDGGAGNDRINGGTGDDLLAGGNGDDVLTGGLGADELHGEAGTDTVSYAGRTESVIAGIDGDWGHGAGGDLPDWDWDYIATSVENLTGGAGNDTLSGSDGANVLVGGGGNDSLDGYGGNDKLFGGRGNDNLSGDAGHDYLNGGGGTNSCIDDDPLHDSVRRCVPEWLPDYTSILDFINSQRGDTGAAWWRGGGDTGAARSPVDSVITVLSIAVSLVGLAFAARRWADRVRN